MAAKKRRHSKRLTPKRMIGASVHIFVKFFPIILITALFSICFNLVTYFLFDSNYFKVRTIRVVGEGANLRYNSLISGLSTRKGDNIFRLDIRRYASEIERNHPDLKDINVKRVLPDVIELTYKARRPFLQIESAGYYYFASDDGVVLLKGQEMPVANLPLITGIAISERSLSSNPHHYSNTLKKAIALLKEIRDTKFYKRYKISKINIYDPDNPSIYLEDETRIEMGGYGFKEKEALLQKVLDELEANNKRAKVIDLRFKDIVVIPR